MGIKSFEVNGDTCIRCGLCVSDCVCAIIEMGDKPFIANNNLTKCILCGHCQSICPTDSITLDGINPQSLANVEKPVEENVIEGIVKNRRSMRQFHPAPIDKSLLEKAITIAAWAPTASNIRDMGLTIINGREKVENLMRACVDIMEKYGLFLEMAADIRKNKDVLFRGAPCVLVIYAPERPFSISDCATTLASIELSLPSLGLSSCWTGLFTMICDKEIPAGLTIPEGRKILGGLMIGRPKVKYRKIPQRPIPPMEWV